MKEFLLRMIMEHQQQKESCQLLNRRCSDGNECCGRYSCKCSILMPSNCKCLL